MTGSFGHGDTIAIALADGVGVALVSDAGVTSEFDETTMVAALREIEQTISPRWVWWTADTARALVAVGLRPARCWDLEAVHRLLVGGWRGGIGRIWAHRRGLDGAGIPQVAAPDLFSQPGNDHEALRPDGYLGPAWIDGLWKADLDHLRTWASLALDVHRWQVDELEQLPDRPAAPSTARSESAAALLCAELEADGLPIDIAVAERIISSFIGPRPVDAADEARLFWQSDRRFQRGYFPRIAHLRIPRRTLQSKS